MSKTRIKRVLKSILKGTLAVGCQIGGLAMTNHSTRGLKVRSAVKAGGLACTNHSTRQLAIA